MAETETSSAGPTRPDPGDVTVERYVAPAEREDDSAMEAARPGLRPARFEDYLGQQGVKENLKVYVDAARKREQPLDHVILHGPPGLGKTTLAKIIASEMEVPLHETRGPSIDRAGDLAGILTGLEPGSVLFVDEIHRLSIRVEEVLYSAMEDYQLDIIVGQGASARTVKMPVAPFTLVGATTRLSLLSKPLRERFGIPERLSYYDNEALQAILSRSAEILGIEITAEGRGEIACRSRGTPRIANRLLKRVWDFTAHYQSVRIDRDLAARVLTKQGIDEAGLDSTDRRILATVAGPYKGGPVGIDALSATLNEDRATLEEVYEPYLVYRGFLARGPRGRTLTEEGERHLTAAMDAFADEA